MITFTGIDFASFGEDFLEQIVDWITVNFDPEDVFDFSTLEKWAEQNDYVKKDESEE